MFTADSEGKIYRTEFSSSPFAQAPFQTQEITLAIKDDADNWYVYDMAIHKSFLWVASDIGVYKVDITSNTWWRMEYAFDTIVKFIPFNERLVAYSCDITSTEMDTRFSWVNGGGPA